jgi:pimeloyl-ACP methyl ester carboxylesterase
LGKYVGEDPVFEAIEQVEAYVKEKYAPFGPMEDDEWRELAEYSSYKNPDGYYRMAYDPMISENYRKYWLLAYFNVWEYWEKIECPVLILRGTESDFLTENLRDRMMDTLPHAELIEFEGAGHTPTLRSMEQIVPIKEWLDK